jgi:hypothetical protein
MPPPPSTAWMAPAFLSTSETLPYQNGWLSNSKLHDLVKECYFCNGNDDGAKELKFAPASFVCAINQKWKETLDDFTAYNNNKDIFGHVAKPFTSSGKRRTITYYYVTKLGQHPKKPQAAQTFMQEDDNSNIGRSHSVG